MADTKAATAQRRRSIAQNWGPYVHRKGGVYLALGAAQHSEDGGELVVYIGANGRLWARPAPMFHDGRFARPWRGLGARMARVAQRAGGKSAAAVLRALGASWGPFRGRT